MDKLDIVIVQGVEGNSVYIDDYRVAGPKPWGGGSTLHTFKANRKDIVKALNLSPSSEDSKIGD